jgi:ribonuclease E
MLINAQSSEELRIAVVAGKTLENYQVEAADTRLTRGNIYRGTIVAIQPSLNAAFIDYGAERHGFLPIQDVVPEAYYNDPKGNARPRIEEVLERGKPIVVQVNREPEGEKGAALTTSLSFAGRYLVLTPFEATRGISRKVEDDATRKELRQVVNKLDVPKGSGVIVRTNALGQTKKDLSRDLSALLRLWKQVGTAARQGRGIKLLYSDQDLILRVLRDYLDSGMAEILVDDDEAFEKAQGYLRAFLPRGKTQLIRYADRVPLFARYDLEPQIDHIYQRSVGLPSGGSIVIDRTEALTAIDINSGKSTKGATQAETALSTNLEAADEVARQLRLRDIGGLVVVDFIDMRPTRHNRKVEKVMRDAMKLDKARASVGRLSPNGLLEINRQRIQQELRLRTHRACPTCDGTGRIASPEMVGLKLLRRIEGRAATGNLKRVRAALHPELADHFQNTRRREIAALEEEFDIHVEVIAASHLHRPEQEIDWMDRDPDDQPLRKPKPKGQIRRAPKNLQPTVEVADLAAAADGDDAGEAEEKKSSRPRRRRPRRRKPAAAAAAAEGNGNAPAAQQQTAGKAEGNGDGAEEGAPKPRRRRRGGRGRGRGRGGTPAEGAEAGGGDGGDQPAAN